jgi:hypothetical protein
VLPEITLIAGTAVDWPRFVAKANETLGRSPTRELDNCKMAVGSAGSYLAALAEYANPGSNPITAAKEADRVLTHISFSFLVSCDPATAVAVFKQSVGIVFLPAEPSRCRENFIATGNLRDWRTAVVEACVKDGAVEARLFYNQVWVVLDKLGFRDIFARYFRRDLKDQSFSLEERKKP